MTPQDLTDALNAAQVAAAEAFAQHLDGVDATAPVRLASTAVLLVVQETEQGHYLGLSGHPTLDVLQELEDGDTIATVLVAGCQHVATQVAPAAAESTKRADLFEGVTTDPAEVVAWCEEAGHPIAGPSCRCGKVKRVDEGG